MAIKVSTAAINMLAHGMSLRRLLDDCVMDIYSGTPPTYADDAATGLGGVKLCRVTVGSNAVATTMRSLPASYTLVMVNRTNANTVKVNVTVDGAGPTTYTYTFVTAVDSSDLIAAANVARWLEENVPQIKGVAYAAVSFAGKGSIDGLAITLSDGSGTTAITTTQIQAASRSSIYTLQWGPPTAGVISKTSDVWSGGNIVTGVAGFFRFVWPNDTGALVTVTEPRVQGSIATSGADYNVSNTTFTVSATHTVESFSLTLPRYAT